MRVDWFDYDLPEELIAQTPTPRGQSRLLVLHRANGAMEHRRFADLTDYLRPNDALVLNDTRVTARRLEALREGGFPTEVLLLRPNGDRAWDALIRPAKSLRPGKTLTLLGPLPERERLEAQVIGATPEGGRTLEFANPEQRDRLTEWGATPLPPYIHTALAREEEERYQTVYAREGGSVAAPTAGLHFTPELLEKINGMGVAQVALTLHVGVGTFRPMRSETVEEHEMHAETMHLSVAAAERINAAQGRIIAVGTTSVRSLETAAREAQRRNAPGRVVPYAGETDLFITPGFAFRAVDALITNFHLPKSTLLMLVSALAGREQVLEAYREAVREKYRFFSFGDAMLIV
jgi:S-adenosylmethionine:tRNA ribosyltransferase-isomerase